MDKSVYSFYRKQKSQPIVLMIVSVGVMFILQAIVRFIIGPNDRKFFDGEKFIIHALDFKAITGFEEGLTIKSTQLITVVVAILSMIALFYFLQCISVELYSHPRLLFYKTFVFSVLPSILSIFL